MPKFRVLHLVNEFDETSVNRIIEYLAQNFNNAEFQLHVGSLRHSGSMRARYHGLGVETVALGTRKIGPGNVREHLQHYIQLQQIHLIHSHSPRTALIGALAVSSLANLPHLNTRHVFIAANDRRWGWAYVFIDRLSLYLVDHIITVSQAMEQRVLSLPGIVRRRISVIQNGVPCETFFSPQDRDPCRAEFGISPQAQVIGYTGRLERVKHVDLLITAFSKVSERYPDARLLVVGDGSMRGRLQSLCNTLNLGNRVIWTGFRSDIPRLLAAIDVFVQPSTNEGLSLSLLEAMAAGKTTIASDVGGVREIIVPDVTGVIFPSDSLSALTSSLSEILANPERQRIIGETARKAVRERFGVKRMAEDYEQLYRQYLGDA